ncbi:MAG: phosphonoacetaldehyde reductase [Candidatus Electryonea clarkiae]|nr:phosphonoacetaldehyde reductase [Candidatus Electryonea clarkiae]MDP8286779.1 phosphonoacetaldehyde reductase [Candidatus Electryonea clarkiae]
MEQVAFVNHNSIEELRTILSQNAVKRVFLVSGKRSFTACRANVKLRWLREKYQVIKFSDFEVNPQLKDVARGVQLFKQNDSDCVIAVGGGSVIDMAKLINYFSANDLGFHNYTIADSSSVREGKLLIAIPTTSGSGSEATHFAVFYVGRVKHSAAHETILPDVAIIDPNLSSSQPPYISAASGLDALCQAIESYWSIHSDDESKTYSRRAIELVLPNLVQSVVAPNPAARLAMAEAAHFAGKAINITKTTAPHAISYPITAYFNVAHGHAVGLILPSMLEFNGLVTSADVSGSRGASYVRDTIREIVEMLGETDLVGARSSLQKLMKNAGLETRLSKLGIDSDEDIELIIENGFNPDRVRNNPRLLTEEAVRAMLNEIR